MPSATPPRLRVEHELGVAVEPALELGHRDQLAPAATHDPDLRGDVRLPEVPRDPEGGAGLLHVEGEPRACWGGCLTSHILKPVGDVARAIDLPGWPSPARRAKPGRYALRCALACTAPAR